MYRLTSSASKCAELDNVLFNFEKIVLPSNPEFFAQFLAICR